MKRFRDPKPLPVGATQSVRVGVVHDVVDDLIYAVVQNIHMWLRKDQVKGVATQGKPLYVEVPSKNGELFVLNYKCGKCNKSPAKHQADSHHCPIKGTSRSPRFSTTDVYEMDLNRPEAKPKVFL